MLCQKTTKCHIGGKGRYLKVFEGKVSKVHLKNVVSTVSLWITTLATKGLSNYNNFYIFSEKEQKKSIEEFRWCLSNFGTHFLICSLNAKVEIRATSLSTKTKLNK